MLLKQFSINNLHLQQNTNIETLLTMLKKLFVKYNLTSSVQKITEGLQKSTVSECIETHNNENIKHAKALLSQNKVDAHKWENDEERNEEKTITQKYSKFHR